MSARNTFFAILLFLFQLKGIRIGFLENFKCLSEIQILLISPKVVNLPIIDALRPRPDYLPLSIPEEISQRLITLHGTPSAWFIGRIVHYIMRPSPEMESFITKARAKFRFRTPIVGVHVRRTDKVGTEASFHPLSEYMRYVEEYFDGMEIARQRARKV